MRSVTIGGKPGYYVDVISSDVTGEITLGSFYAYTHNIERMFKIPRGEKQTFLVDSHRERYTIKSYDDYHVERSVDPATDLCHVVLLKKDEVNNEQKTFTFFMLEEGVIKSEDFFNKLNSVTSIPILEEWKDYIFTRLMNSAQIRRRNVYDFDGGNANLQMWHCSSSDTQILNIVSAGLEQGDIFIDAHKRISKLDESIGLDAYLGQFSSDLTTRIQDKFTARFNPLTDKYSKPILDFEDWCYNSGRGIQLFDAQKSVGAASVKCLNKEHVVFVVGEMGVGKCLPS